MVSSARISPVAPCWPWSRRSCCVRACPGDAKPTSPSGSPWVSKRRRRPWQSAGQPDGGTAGTLRAPTLPLLFCFSWPTTATRVRSCCRSSRPLSSAGRRPNTIRQSQATRSAAVSLLRVIRSRSSSISASLNPIAPAGSAAALPLPRMVVICSGQPQPATFHRARIRSCAICLARLLGSHWRSAAVRRAASSGHACRPATSSSLSR